jgi:alpha-mannosidase
MTKDAFNAIIISETHWDRAWYLTFQQFRLQLVKLVDGLLTILEQDPEFTHYTFDGQTVVLEDYLEVKPLQKERILKLVKQGRIDIGPWYILPDVFLVSGESLIRNLLRGSQIASEFGRRMDVGYIPDPFGQVSQLPQILSQFSIDSIIFGRGTGDESEELGAEFIWEGTDGSSVLAHWLPLGYGNIANLPDDVQDAVSVIEDVIAQLKPRSIVGTYLLMNGSDHLTPQQHLPQIVDKFNQTHNEKIVIGTLPMFVDLIRVKKGMLKKFRGEFRRSKYQNLLSGVYSARVYLKQANDYSQRILERVTEPWGVIASLIGRRYPSEEIRLAWKYLLQNHPHDDICGCSIDEVHDDGMQRFRWIDEITAALNQDTLKALVTDIQSDHPGVAVFNSSSYMRSGVAVLEIPASDYRYSRLANVELRDIMLEPTTPLEAAKNEIHISYVRQQGFDLAPTREDVVTIGSQTLHEFEFDFSALAMLFPSVKRMLRHLSTAYKIRVNSANRIVEVWARKYDASEDSNSILGLVNSDGEQIPLQLLGYEMKEDLENHVTADREEFLRFAIAQENIPALGRKRYDMEFLKEEPKYAVDKPVVVTGNRIENSMVSVEVNKNGILTVTDKRNSQVYDGVLKFEDSADMGDSYDYCPAWDKPIIFDDIEVDIEEGYGGPLVGSLFVTGTLQIPVNLDSELAKRSEEKTDCDFVTELTLMYNSPTIRVMTVVNNDAEDHRLRVLFPTSSGARECSADSTFDVISRPIRPSQRSEWHQPVAPTYPLRNFVSLGEKGRGLAITTKGLVEFEILEEDGGTIALTLVRSVGWLSRMGFPTRGESAGPIVATPGAQCQGENTYEFAITPHSGLWLEDQTYLESEEYLLPLEAHFVPKGEEKRGTTELQGIELSPACMRLSALKMSENEKHVVLRFWNISDKEDDCTIKTGFDVNKIVGGQMDECVDPSLALMRIGPREWKVRVPSRRVITLLLDVKRGE